MRKYHSLSGNFSRRLEAVISLVIGLHPEQAIQLPENLMMEASENHIPNNVIGTDLRMYFGRNMASLPEVF